MMPPPYRQTITLLNRLKAQDTEDKRSDVWFKTVLHGVALSAVAVGKIEGTTGVSARKVIARVPRNERYSPYEQWAKEPARGFTFSTGDIVIRGEIEEGRITPQAVGALLQVHGANAFTVTAFKDNTGTIARGEHYRLEGE